jgi:hypothetical protein
LLGDAQKSAQLADGSEHPVAVCPLWRIRNRRSVTAPRRIHRVAR